MYITYNNCIALVLEFALQTEHQNEHKIIAILLYIYV